MAAQHESHVTVWKKAVVRCISVIFSRFDSEHSDSEPHARSPAGPGRHVYDLPPACARLYDPGPAGHGSTDQLPVRSLKRAMKLSERRTWPLAFARDYGHTGNHPGNGLDVPGSAIRCVSSASGW